MLGEYARNLRSKFNLQGNKEKGQVDEPTKGLKVFGERNSGTQFTTQLIRKNYHCEVVPGTLHEATKGYRDEIEERVDKSISDPASRLWAVQALMDDYFAGNLWLTLGWKHAAPDVQTIAALPDLDNHIFVTITKNPYAWVLSMYRRPYEYLGLTQKKTLDEFIAEPWLTVRRENAPAIIQSPVELWSIKASAYQQLTGICDVLHVRYEDVISEPGEFLNRLSRKLVKRNPEFNLDIQGTKAGNEHRGLEYYQDYYLNERWRDLLNDEQIRAINQYLNPVVVRACGYEIID